VQTVVRRSMLRFSSIKLSCGCLLLRYDCLLLRYNQSLLGLLYSEQDLRLHFLTGKGSAADTNPHMVRFTCSRCDISMDSGRYVSNSSRAAVRELYEGLVISHRSRIHDIAQRRTRALLTSDRRASDCA
jgi:hypothetical protein